MVTTFLAALTLTQGPGFLTQPFTGSLAQRVTWRAEVGLPEAMEYIGARGVSVVFREAAFSDGLGRPTAQPDGTVQLQLPKLRISLTDRPIGEAMAAIAVAYEGRWEQVGETFVLVPAHSPSGMGRPMGATPRGSNVMEIPVVGSAGAGGTGMGSVTVGGSFPGGTGLGGPSYIVIDRAVTTSKGRPDRSSLKKATPGTTKSKTSPSKKPPKTGGKTLK